MKKNQIHLIAILIFTLSSCVNKSEYDKVILDNNTLKAELNELKYGSQNLLKQAKNLQNTGEFNKAIQTLEVLLEKHGNKPEANEAKMLLPIFKEENIWSIAANENNIENVQSYISNYPNGKYVKLAKERLLQLLKEKEETEYKQAESSNTSSGWKSFLKNYPNRSDAEDIRKYIIKLEVEEIMGSSSTGSLPSSNYSGSSNYTSSSTVTITNGTNCSLIVRYSGPDIKSIEIPDGASKTIYLSSGNYKIAASACGSNYAGSESLGGSYNSRYYIETSRY